MVSPPCYGLLTRQKEPVPLKSISVTLSIREFVAGVSATLNYENEGKDPLEAFFVFPMDEDSAVHSFEALVDGKKIVAELQEKSEARTNYENAISQGHQAFLLEEDDQAGDIFSCNVGNLPPGSKAALTLKYVQELPLEADGALRYVLPAILNPRYQLSGGPEGGGLQMKTPAVPSKDVPYTLSLAATVSSQHAIQSVQCSSPVNPIEYLADKTSAQISLAEGHKFDRDVELLVYYSEVHTPSVAVEMGAPATEPGSLMGDPSAMVSFYPNIPEAQSPTACGEFVFLMDRSGSMHCPMNNQNPSQLRIQAAKETLIWLLKSLPVGCYFNIFGFGSSFESFFPESVKYTQDTMEQALKRVKSMDADLGGTEILEPLKAIYSRTSIPGHPLQLFVFTDGEVNDTFSVIREVKSNGQRHRCFSFGIGEGASTSLIKGIARASGGAAEFITGNERMQSKALRALKRSLQPVVEDVSLSWDLPAGLSAKMLSPEPTVIFRGQRLIVYAQLTGTMPPAEATGKVCLKYTLQGTQFENQVAFSLQPKSDANLTIHRLAAKSFIQTKDMGFEETPANDKKEVLKISMECGVISSHTAFIAINKDLNKPLQGPLTRSDVPSPMLFAGSMMMCSPGMPRGAPVRMYCSSAPMFGASAPKSRFSLKRLGRRLRGGGPISLKHQPDVEQYDDCYDSGEMSQEGSSIDMTDLETNHTDDPLVQLISLQKADGSWDLNEGLAVVLGMSLGDMQAALPVKVRLGEEKRSLSIFEKLGSVKRIGWIMTHLRKQNIGDHTLSKSLINRG
ncbi:von Willebrand factor A domain-containing protein 5A [Myotis brandtii]|uniref:von Willebrand factor A domain-containing protein 5A n=1 Tax=Myotis brandtii TaxID=109478 RepID=S7NIX0_MYOBR|nr:PREDICTED: von Willebrand factor A domain-containing protein 5A [Myotis brandtii]XP_005880445.1 PREDICTED: von Willebrand factor A domain-containing protein 5A [Myotis brandtii]XP_005880446.1 PREDICTED: von Willebrand factor A domain-containing protein 5A [Myotis brandtii]XP_005880447.1 PREDICTED: von Willebrand factor A domain-containing protein 5A [Myotis brandtii]XP_014383967.1 PREDICTED: von Willebrand factor A domain-containing protein 5A [Myotis brandtii]XP_014383968.1 PREDICTED: von 